MEKFEFPKFAIIIGVGGAGCNVLSYIYKNCNYDSIDFFALNTDMQALSALEIPLSAKLLIGENITHGNGAGADTEKGRLSAMESAVFIKNKLKSNDYSLAFIVAGMGGGTGTGAAPIIANICKSMDIYTIAICSKPFSFEGYLRQKQANEGINKLKQNVDNIAIFSNDNIINSNSFITIFDAFKTSDEIFYIPIETIFSILETPGYINLDFADILTTLRGSKLVSIAYGVGKGEKRITNAFENLKKSPFLNNIQIEKSKQLLLNLSFSEEGPLVIEEMNEIQNFMSIFGRNIDVIWGTAMDSRLNSNEVKFSMIIAGITDEVLLEQ